jgi:hypothetical protein
VDRLQLGWVTLIACWALQTDTLLSNAQLLALTLITPPHPRSEVHMNDPAAIAALQAAAADNDPAAYKKFSALNYK